MSFSKQRASYTQVVCPNKSYLPKIGANEVDLPGPVPPTPRLMPRPRPLPQLGLLHSPKEKHSRSSIPPRSHDGQNTRSYALRLHRTLRRRAGAQSRLRRRSLCGKRTTVHCTAGNAICRCIRIRLRRGCIYFCMRCGIRPVLGYLRPRCRSGLRRGGSGNVPLEDH